MPGMRVAVIGLGKLGLPLATVLANAGHQVIGADRSQKIVDAVNAKSAPFEEWGLQEALEGAGDLLSATTDSVLAARNAQVSFIIVPTPSDEHGRFSNEYVLEACDEVGAAIKDQDEWHLVVISSTVMPGSTNGVIRERLEAASGKKMGQGFSACYSPEFIALGTVIKDMQNPDMVLIGQSDTRAGDVMEKLALSWIQNEAVIHRLSVIDAEIAKISVNAYVTMKISYANTLAEICEKTPGADALQVAKAIGSDRRIGYRYLIPATAFGGPCFNRDSVAFGQFAKDAGVSAPLADATDEVNDHQIRRLIELIKSHGTGKVSILGLAYKSGTPVHENSVGVDVAVAMLAGGWQVFVYDPMARPWGSEGPAVALSAEECVSKSDLVVVATPWHEFRSVNLRGKTVIDCWGIVRSAGKLFRIGEGGGAR